MPTNLLDHRARLAAANADKAELDISIARGEYVKLSDALELWSKVITDCRTRFLAIPSKAAPECFKRKKKSEVQAVLVTEVHEALHDLAEIDAARYFSKRGTPAILAATGANDQPVGRPRKKVKSRKQRGARKVANK
jgi:hypothetical protein